MSCNCKVNQKIDYLHKKYGHNIPVSKKTKISFTIKETIKKILAFCVGILFLPIILIYVFWLGIFSKKKQISVKKILNNVRNK